MNKEKFYKIVLPIVYYSLHLTIIILLKLTYSAAYIFNAISENTMEFYSKAVLIIPGSAAITLTCLHLYKNPYKLNFLLNIFILTTICLPSLLLSLTWIYAFLIFSAIL